MIFLSTGKPSHQSVCQLSCAAILGALLALTTVSQAAVVDVSDGDFSSVNGNGAATFDLTPGWYEGSTGSSYTDYGVDPTAGGSPYGSQFPGYAGGGVGFLEGSGGYFYQSIGTADGSGPVQVDWLHINRTVSTADGLTVSIYSNPVALVEADGSTLASLGATLVGNSTVAASTLGFTNGVFGTSSQSVQIDISGVTNGHFLYVELVREGAGGNAIIDDVTVSAIPEPSTCVLATVGLLGLFRWGRRRRR